MKRFWDKVSIPEDVNGCWEWTACKHTDGYGMFRNGKMMFSHRMAYVLTFGRFPSELCVLHKCDNPPCCNPNHLFLGTVTDNARDMLKKGRSPHVKIPLEDIPLIQARYNAGELQKNLAAEYGVGRRAVSFLKRRVIP